MFTKYAKLSIQDRLDRETKSASESASEFPWGEVTLTQTGAQPVIQKTSRPTFVFTNVEETKVNRRD